MGIKTGQGKGRLVSIRSLRVSTLGPPVSVAPASVKYECISTIRVERTDVIEQFRRKRTFDDVSEWFRDLRNSVSLYSPETYVNVFLLCVKSSRV